MMDKLKECPFCGSHKVKLFYDERQNYRVECCGCHKTVLFHIEEKSSQTKAIEIWNRRTQPENKPTVRKECTHMQFVEGGIPYCEEKQTACNGRIGRENKPLSLEELRQMERCPVWAIDGAGHSDYVLMDSTGGLDSDAGLWDIDFYNLTGVDGKLHASGWLAYKTKPKQEEK